MKKENGTKNKKWLWLAIGIAALLVVVGVVLGIVLGGGNSDGEQLGGRPDLYWNADRATYLSEDTGIAASNREPAADGYYYIRFAYNGEYVEYPVADKKLVNFIDSMDLVGLVFDSDGMIVDAKLPNEVAVEVGIKLYLQSAAADKLVTNTSIAMNGMKNEVILGDLAQIYNVSKTAENIGEIIDYSKLELMDTLYVYGNKLGEITHVYLTNRSEKSPIYWRCEQMYANKKTTRVPDENGVYTVDFYCDGEVVSLKFKDEELVTTIDSTSRYSPCFSFTFDDDGYVTGKLDTGLATRTVQHSARYDVVSITDGFVETTKFIGSNSGAVDSFRVDENTIVYDASKSAVAEGRGGKQVEGLQVGDRIVAWTDTEGVAVIVYVSNRVVDSPAYYVPTRKYDSTLKETTRVPNAQGRYEIELLREGDSKNSIYWTTDKALMTQIDADINKCVGLKVGENNEILAVYDVEALFGNTSFCRGRYVSDFNGIVGAFATLTDPDNPKQGVIGAGCRIYNVSSVGEYGSETTLQYGDYVYAWRQPSSEITFIYITKRKVDYDVYYNLSRKYDSVNKVTTREPDENGWYVYTLAVNGKQVEVKTKDKEMATFMDSVSPGMLALLVDSNGVVLDAQYGYYATGGVKRYSSYLVKSVNNDGTVTLVYPGSVKENILLMTDTCEVWNVSQVYESHRGEKTSLQVGDKVTALTNIRDEAQIIYVREREVDNMYINKQQMYDSTNSVSTRKPDANGWYWYELAVNGQVKKFKTNKVEFADKIDYYGGGFGLVVDGDLIKAVTSPSYVKDVKSSGVTNWDVTAINGNKVTVTYHSPGSKSDGTSKTFTLASNAKIYDVTPTSDNFGAAAKLQVGDRIRTYINEDDEALYVYIKYHNTRQKGSLSYCEHCGEVVYWSPWMGGSFPTGGGHFYLPMNVTTDKSSSVGRSESKPVSNVVLDLNGYTYCRTTSRAIFINENGTFSLMDTVGGGKLTAVGSEGGYGGVIYVSQSTFNLYSGTLAPAQDNVPGARGGVVYMTGGAKAVFNMYGGTICGGETAPNSEYAYSQGGNIFVNSGVFNMYGGKISGGTSKDGVIERLDKNGNPYTSTIRGMGGNIYSRLDTARVNIYGGTIENGTAYGGGNVSGAGQWKLSGGTISGGYAAYRGGSFYISDGNWEFSGVTVSGGESKNRGGNIYVTSPTPEDGKEPVYSVVTVSGGTVSGGKAGTDGDNIAIVSGSIFNMTGGNVSNGSIYLGTGVHTVTGGKLDCLTEYKGGQLTVSGKPVITNLSVGKVMTIGELTTGAKISVNADGIFTNELTNAENYVQYFESLTEGTEIGVVDNTLAVVKEKLVDPNGYTAMCEHCGQNVEWSEWAYLSGSGHYYLADQKSITEEQIEIAQGEDVIVDLKGQTITATDVRAFSVKGELSILDTVGGGMVTGNGPVSTSNVEGALLSVSGTLNLLDGTLCLADTHNPVYRAGVIFVGSAAQVNISGGTVSGGEVTNRGGNIYVYGGELNVSGGTITDGAITVPSNNLDYGGNIGVASNGKVNISGGTVSNGSVYLGSGTHTISGGTVADKVTVYSSNCLTVSGNPTVDYLNMYDSSTLNVGQLETTAKIYVNTIGAFTAAVENAQNYTTIFEAKQQGYEVTADNNILSVTQILSSTYDAACPHCDGATVTWSKWTGAAASGHFYMDGPVAVDEAQITVASGMDMVLDLKGQTITATDYRAFRVDGKLSVMDSANGGTIIGNGVKSTSTVDGGVIYVTGSNAEFNLYSGTVKMAATHNTIRRGGVIYITGGSTVNILGGTVADGVSNERGGNITVVSNSRLNISGGEITGGSPYSLHIGSGTHSISGGTVSGKINYVDGTLEVSGEPYISRLIMDTSSKQLTVGTLTGAASIAIDATGTFTGTLTDAQGSKQYFAAYDSNEYQIDVVANALAVVEKTTGGEGGGSTANLCPCGCGVALDQIQWTEISLEDGVSSDYYIEQDGHYRVAKDVRGNTGNLIRVKAANAVVDLNGKAIANKGRAFYHADNVGGNLYILDIAGGATVTTIDYDSSNKNNGALTGCWIATKGNVSVYGGSWSSTTSVAGTSTNTTRMIFVRDGSISIYGGTFDATGVVGGHGIMGAYRETASAFNISGGTFIGGDGNGAGDVWTVNAASTLNISGGTFQGKIYAKAAESTIKLSGAPVIDDLDLTAGAKLTLGELTQGADITVKADKGTVIAEGLSNADSYATYFKAADGLGVAAEDNKLVVAELCPCGCGVALSKIQWTEVTFDNTVVDPYLQVTASGHYRVMNDITTGASNLFTFTSDATNVVIDMNGKTMAGIGRFANYTVVGGKLSIIDTAGTATYTMITSHTVAGTTKNNSAALTGGWLATKQNEVNIYGGSWYCTSTVVGTSTNSPRMIYVNEGMLNIYGGTFDASGAAGGHGIMGAYRETASTFNIFGGTFIGGNGNGVGDVWTVNAASTLNITGGTFQGKIYAKAAGSTINLSGAPVVSDLDLTQGAMVTLGELTEGASIAVAAGNAAFSVANEKAETYAAYFDAVAEGKTVQANADNQLVIVDEVASTAETASQSVFSLMMRSVASFFGFPV